MAGRTIWRALFSLKGDLNRVRYALAATTAFFSQHMLALALLGLDRPGLDLPWWFWVNPLRVLGFGGYDLPAWAAPAAMVVTLVVAWIEAALALRRGRAVGDAAVFTTLAVVPLAQPFVILWLSLWPGAPAATEENAEEPRAVSNARSTALGVLVGVGLSIAAVLISGVLLGSYNYVLFVATPFAIGLCTGFIVNRAEKRSFGHTFMYIASALLLGALALIGLAFEGVMCLVMAFPLALAMGFVGGLIGRGLALTGRARNPTISCAVLLPVLMLAETAAPPQADFTSSESIEIAAPPDAVWHSITHMGEIAEPPPAPFRWGLAYPMRGEILGEGVGAVRRGVFSTGVAYERVTIWEPDRRLTFIVLTNPPTMRELSPYPEVHAHHLHGYFETLDADFTIAPLQDGRTRLTLTTSHRLRIGPTPYWTPLAQWVTHANKQRVLDHFRRRAEAR